MKYPTSKFTTLLALCLFSLALQAQPKELKIVDDVTSILGDNSNKVSKATVQSETGKTASIQVEFTGFKDKDYLIKASILNQLKKPLKELEPVQADLDSRSGLADFFFTFKQLQGKVYPQAFLESAFVEISITDKKGLGATPGLEAFGIGAKKYTFQYKKKWPVKGAGGQEVTVTLIPYKSAGTIKP